jgi:hypothetical protein
MTTPLPTPNLMITQSPSGASLCRFVSQPSNQAPFSVKVLGRQIGGKGFIRFEAEAKNSSENAMIFPPSAEDARSEHHQVTFSKKKCEQDLPMHDEVKSLSNSDAGTCTICEINSDILVLGWVIGSVDEKNKLS